MAMTTFCDWCGELMEVPEGEAPLYLRGQGHGGGAEGIQFLALDLRFNYHAGESHRHAIDPDCCLGQLETFLAERAAWAHDKGMESHEWRLVPRKDAQPIQSPSALRISKRYAVSEEKRAEREAEMAKYDRWKELSKEERMSLIRDELLEGGLTAREVADRLDREDMAVWDSQVRPLLKQMQETGELGREEERYRAGSSIRHRYFIPDQEES